MKRGSYNYHTCDDWQSNAKYKGYIGGIGNKPILSVSSRKQKNHQFIFRHRENEG
jgi:hypothetical protein